MNLHQNQIVTLKYINLMDDKKEEAKGEVTKNHEEFEGQISVELYRELLERSYEKVAGLKQALAAIQNQTVNLRDRIATKVYPTTLVDASSTEEAAEDAYRAADALLRVRETGRAYDSDLIDLLKQMKDSSETDQVFGRTVRTFLTDK